MRKRTQSPESAAVSLLRNKVMVRRRLKTAARISNAVLLALMIIVCILFIGNPLRMAISVACVSGAIFLCNWGGQFDYRIPMYTFDALGPDDISALPFCLEAFLAGWVENKDEWIEKVSELVLNACITPYQWDTAGYRIIDEYSRDSRLPLSDAIQNFKSRSR